MIHKLHLLFSSAKNKQTEITMIFCLGTVGDLRWCSFSSETMINIIFFLTGLFSGICGHILKNYKWFINYILCPNQQNKPEISINLGLGTWGDQSCTHSSQTTATIITWIFRLRGLFSGMFGTIFNNYRWFINYFFCSIQQKKPEISTIFASGAGSYQSCSYSAQT